MLTCHTGEKTTLSYAAIFGIRDDLHLVGTEYSWLSSLFYFGFLVWAFPTNFLLQRLPIGEYSFMKSSLVVCTNLMEANISASISSCGKSFHRCIITTQLTE